MVIQILNMKVVRTRNAAYEMMKVSQNKALHNDIESNILYMPLLPISH